jgi:Na+/H+-dicarboxylate symporter
MSLTRKILTAMALGIATGIALKVIFGLGGDAPPAGAAVWVQDILIDGIFDTGGQIFVASLTLLVVPLVFVSLVCGSAALSGHSRMGPMALKTIGLYLFTTAMAISLALLLGVLLQPGTDIGAVPAPHIELKTAPSIKDTLVNIIPNNPLRAMVEANMLQVIVFALLFGSAIARTPHPGAKSILKFFEDLNEVILKMVMMLMEIAPYGVFCLLVKLFASMGFDAIAPLVIYFFTVLCALLLHGFGVYGLLLKLFSRLNPRRFYRKMWPVMIFGFSTASSNATLPVTLRTVQEGLGVDNKVASFSVPLGATINMDGTAIMQGVATVFIAQAYQIDIGLMGYLMVILTATLASIGTAGVPGVGLITLTMVLQQVGLPVEGIALIIGVDRLLDMIRTAVNITGDAMVSTIVAKQEGLLDEQRYHS